MAHTMVGLPPENAAPERTSRRHFWLAVVVVGVCFFVTEHDVHTPLNDTFSSSAGDLVELTSGGNGARRLAFVSLAMLGAVYCCRPATHQFRLANGLALLVLFSMAWSGASVFWSIDPSMAMRRLVVLACCFIGAVGISRRLSVRELVTLSLVISTSYLAIGIGTEIALGTLRPWVGGYRFAGTVHPNTQGLNLVVLCFSAYSLARDAHRHRLLLFCLFCVGFVFLLLTKSRTSCAGALLGLMTLWSLKASLRTQILAGLGCVAAVTAVALVNLLLATEATDNVAHAMLLGRTEQSGSLTGRLPLWTELSPYISERPLHGYGFESFWTADHVAAVSAALQWGIHEAHSAYVETLLNLGLVGAMALLTSVLLATWRARQRYLTRREAGYDFFFALFVFALINSFTESGMVLPMCVPFLAGCGLSRLAFYRAEQTSRACSPTNDFQINTRLCVVGA